MKTKYQPLVSIIIISYNSWKYIFEAVDSVLKQDYSKIEFIVANDGSSDFITSDVKSYIKTNKRKNILNTVVFNNDKNVGTVKNLNKAIKLCRGSLIVAFAADDIMHNTKVVSSFVNAFSSLPPTEMIVTSQVGMYDVNLKKLQKYFVSNDDAIRINRDSFNKLFSEMSTRTIIPGAGTCYKREIFEKYSLFDEKYKLVEDFPSALKLTRHNVRFHYFNFISFKHRHGGVSHGNLYGKESISKVFDLDILNILKGEVYPYIYLLSKAKQKDFLIYLKNKEFEYQYKYRFLSGNQKDRTFFIAKYKKDLVSYFLHTLKNEIKDQLIGKKTKMLIIGLILFLTVNIYSDNHSLKMTQTFIGATFMIVPIMLLVKYLIDKYLKSIYLFFKNLTY